MKDLTNVKKAYLPLVELLQQNSNKKVETLLPEIMKLVESKQIQKAHKTDDNGNVTHVFCYYHKKWEDVQECEYGSKKNTATGLNTMCKEGLSNWTKQQRDFKKSKAGLLDEVMQGTLAPTDIEAKSIQLEQERDKIIPRKDGKGSDSL